MPPFHTACDVLPSAASSTSQTLHQPDIQANSDGEEPSTITPPPKPTIVRLWISQCWTHWKWELAACLFSFAAPISMFITVYYHDGQPLPQWPYGISINPLLSVYTLVLKAAIGVILTSCIGQLQWTWFSETRPLTDMLYFDDATRGAYGALNLVWRQRLRQPLTVVGCVIMVLALSVDPFVQQLIQPMDCSVEVPGDDAAVATLPRTNFFDSYYYDENQKRDERDKYIETVLYNAVFSPRQDPPWHCSTGNCTFPNTYSTIGICYSCQDTSTDVVIDFTCSHPDSSYASQHPTSEEDCPADSSFTIKSNFTADEHIRLGTNITIDSNRLPTTPIYVADSDSYLEPYTSGAFGVRALNFGFIIGDTTTSDERTNWAVSDKSSCGSNESGTSWGCRGYGAASCSLWPCVQAFNATISAGVLREDLIASSPDAEWGMITDILGIDMYQALVDNQCLAQNESAPANEEWGDERRWSPYNLNLTVPDEDIYIAGDETNLPFPSDFTSLLDSGCLYLISAAEIMRLADGYLRGAVQAQSASARGNESVWTLSGFEGPEFIQTIYNRGDTDLDRVQTLFANISDSLTTYIRTHGTDSQQLSGSTDLSRNAQGKVYHYATCLKVRWAWISYPASLSVLAALFLFVVVEVSRKQGSSVWKNSPLAWVLRADFLRNEELPSFNTSGEKMQEESGHIVVHLLHECPDEPRIRMTDIKDPNLEPVR